MEISEPGLYAQATTSCLESLIIKKYQAGLEPHEARLYIHLCEFHASYAEWMRCAVQHTVDTIRERERNEPAQPPAPKAAIEPQPPNRKGKRKPPRPAGDGPSSPQP